jgi:hypothetical protein
MAYRRRRRSRLSTAIAASDSRSLADSSGQPGALHAQPVLLTMRIGRAT